MKRLSFVLPKLALGMLLASGITAVVAADTQPAQAGVQVSVGIRGGYAPNYHWYRWHDGFGWHREWVPVGWIPPAYGPTGYGYDSGYVQPAYRRSDVDRNWDRDRDRNHDRDRRDER
jgi:opacity protein-like surface antigen